MNFTRNLINTKEYDMERALRELELAELAHERALAAAADLDMEAQVGFEA